MSDLLVPTAKESLVDIVQFNAEVQRALVASGGEVDALEPLLDAGRIAEQRKVDAYRYVIVQAEAAAADVADTIRALQAQKKHWQSLVDYMKTNLKTAMHMLGVDRLNGDLHYAKLTKPTRKLVVNEAELPIAYQKQVLVPDTEAITRALEAGEEVPGAHFEETPSLRWYPLKATIEGTKP